MAFQGFGQKQGFGKDSGPVAAPKAEVFGRFPTRPPSPTPPFSAFPLHRSTTRPATLPSNNQSQLTPQRTRSPPGYSQNHALEDNFGSYAQRPSPLPFNNQSQLAPQRTRSPPGYSQNHALEDNFGSYARRPSTLPSNNQSQLATQRTRSPPGYSQNHGLEDNFGSYAQRPSTLPSNNQSQLTPQRTRSPPGYSQNHAVEDNFGSYAQRPSTLPSNNQSQLTPQRTRSPPGYSQNNALEDNFSSYAQRPATSSPMWGNHVRFPGNSSNSWTREDYSGASPSGSANFFANKNADTSAPIITRPPPLQSASVVSPEKSSRTDIGSPAISPTMWGNQVRLAGNLSNSWSRKDDSAVFLSNSGKPFASMHADTRVPERNRSPPLQPQNGVSQEKSSQTDFGRPSPSLPKLTNRTDSISTIPDFVSRDMSRGSAQSKDNKAAVSKATNYPVSKRNRSVEFSATDEVFQRHSAAQIGEMNIGDRPGAVKPTSLPVSKRTRSPPLPANQVLNGNSSPPDDSERESQAKAKRLARFKVELSQPEQSTTSMGNASHSVNKRAQSLKDRSKMTGGHSSEMEEDSLNAGVPSDYEVPESSAVIIGLCPDMCPKSEREERERKGDLDQFERLDGDRNRTAKSLAIKKYTRTAEREAELIRPMPILQNTIAYLLGLLDQPYDEKFLGLYNFLWDRMRAIRMDLRMQHLFNLNAITMLEQMIRLHIIAMHELCETTKGEGFSEGFDAHLNIEQMNKTSVELFQLYEDHRKKGINVPTEKEFRGYYALLKLDKHPGYKVEPAELSHDLSKMTPEIRQTSEVLFARDVARACRTGNFIAFFRLARKASYLQACLMHAHFAKLRTQALASLHCGLQNNQGIPVTLIAKWLAMEEDDIENLLDYHGFVIREFEEPYMVKEGPFLGNENDYPLKCSKLVHLKRSQMIVEDVSSPPSTVLLPAEEPKVVPLMKVKKQEIEPVPFVKRGSPVHVSDAVMAEYRGLPSPKDDAKAKSSIKGLPFVDQRGGGNQMAAFPQFSTDVSLGHNFTRLPQASVESFKTPNHSTLPNSFRKPNDDTSVLTSLDSNTHANEKTMTWLAVSAEAGKDNVSFLERESSMKASDPQDVPIQDVEDELHAGSVFCVNVIESSYDEEAYEAKLRLFLRIWRRRSVKKREVREQRQLAAVDALGSLSLGPPVRQKLKRPSTPEEFNIDHIMYERYQRHERSWSRLNVSDVIAGIVCERNTTAKCICWKMILCSEMIIQGCDKQQQSQFTACSWLLSKLIPSVNYEEDDLVVSSPGISVWKRWVASQNDPEFTCVLSVVRKAELHNARDQVSGANAVLFLASETISLEVQKRQLHSLVMSLPSGSCLPLLVLIDSPEENINSSSAMAENLGLRDLDRSRIGNSSVVFLVENRQHKEFDGFFSDEKLRGGLQWLASQSAPPPVVSCAKTHELVSTHLSSTLEMFDTKSVYEVGPDPCISAFNDALYQTAKKVAAAADANVSSWPCPEIALLDKSSHEYEFMKLYLPNIGWNSPAKIELATSALQSCELASFEDDISWLFEGCNSGSNIENHRILLTDCLIKYLSDRCQIMGSSLARKEAHVMLQQSVRLELQDSMYYVIPNWIKIFRRIFNWRLMSLSDGPFSMVYVLEQDIPRIPSPGSNTSLSPYHMTYPSLDEMVEVSFGSLQDTDDDEEIKAPEPPVTTLIDFSEAAQVTGTEYRIERAMPSFQDMNMDGMTNANHVTTDLPNVTGIELVPVLKASREADRLSKLLEQCNTLQDNIDKKLSIYF